MCLFLYDDDPEPEERVPAGPLYVPARPGGESAVLRLFRTPLGERTAVGFTTPERLSVTLGAAQAWIRLSEPVLRALAAPLGVTLLTVDPTLTAPPVAAAPVGGPGAGPLTRAAGTARTA
ncbi:SAV_915 family protein [Streptomyces sp. M-16]|uniref:SAV_915 family protein n=1 Tax=Streptomyces sp. M-16 TaxID=3233040 RepID=UPI00225B3617